jgi:hypothetical protein
MERLEKIKNLSESLSKLQEELRASIAYADDATKEALCVEGANYIVSSLSSRYMVTVDEKAKKAIFKAFTTVDFSPGIDAYWAKILNRSIYYGEDSRGIYITIRTDNGWSGGRLRKESEDTKYYIPGLSLSPGETYIDYDNGGYEVDETIITAVK